MAPGTPVMLGGPIAPERPKRRRRGVLVAAGTAVALLIGGVAYAGISLWSSPGGTEPEDVMPGGVAAFGRLDLDPALGQQKKIADLLGRFPNRGGSAEERVAQLKKDLIDGLHLPGLKADDVTPWLGDRFGVGLWNRDDKLYGLIALACKDENKAKAAVAKARQSEDRTRLGVAFLDGYAVLALPAEDSGDGQAAADAAVTATRSEKLSGHKAYADLVGKLPSNEVALVYADTAFLIDSLAKGKRSKGEPDFKALLGDNAGQFVAGAQATGDGIEIRLRTSAQSAPAPTGDAGKAADALPGNSIIAAAAVVSDTPALADQLDKSVGSLRELFGASADKFTDGVKALLGSTLTLAVTDLAGKEPSARFSANTTSADKAKKLSDAMTAVFGRTLKPDRQGNRVDVTLGSYKPAGTLGATDLYKRALAGRPDKSVFVGYLDVQRLVPTLGLSASERADIAPVKAVGVAVGVDGNAGTALIRVIIG